MAAVKNSVFFIFALCSILVNACNPVSENVPDRMWNSLHNSKPFQSDYFHGANYRFPDASCSESQCHGTALTGGNSGAPSCFNCHNNQWSVFSINHKTKINRYFHHDDVHDYSSQTSTNSGWFSTCKSCHDSSLGGNQGGPSANFAYSYSCKVCHSGFTQPVPPPGHSAYKSEDSKSGWHHYNYGSADPDADVSNPNNNCSGAACHGIYGSSAGSAIDGSGGIVAAHGPSCSTCH